MTEPSDPVEGGATSDAETATTTVDVAASVDSPSAQWSSTTKIVMGLLLFFGVGWVVYLGRNVITLAALAGLIAYLLSPAIRFAHRRLHLPRGVALLATYLVVFATVFFAGLFMITGIVQSVSDIDVAEAEDSLRSTSIDWLTDVREIKAFGYTIDLSEAVDPIIEQLEDEGATSEADDESDDTNDRRVSLSSEQIQRLFGGLTSSATTFGAVLIATFMSGLVTVLVAMYLNADSAKFAAGIRRGVPAGYQRDAEQFAARIGGIWRGYLFGQLINSAITGLLVGLVLWGVGLPGAFLFGVLMALLNMVPTFGPILAGIPGVLVAFALGSTRFEMDNITFTLLVAGIYVVVVQAQAMLIAPYITGKAVKLSPATVLLGLLIGVQVAGIVGAVLVVPVVATGKEIGRYVLVKLTDQDPYAPREDPVVEEQVEPEMAAAQETG